MYYGGIDIGSAYCKCIIIDEEGIVAKALYPVEGNPQVISQKAVKDALAPQKLKVKHVKKFVTTGRNRKKFPLKNEEMTEVTCIAKGTYNLLPSVRTIIDIGAITNKAIKINEKGKVMEYVINDKCASGSGMFLELVAKALEMEVQDLGRNAAQSRNPLSITNQCTIFAESEVIYLVNEGKSEVDIAAGVCNSIAGNLYSLLKRVRMEKDITLTGGVANNGQIRRNLEERLNFELKTFPFDPSYVAAYGAALFAKEMEKKV
ncbi:MAG: acyl-CoA dehydratase activase [Candidatus Helarchaeota archaeon]